MPQENKTHTVGAIRQVCEVECGNCKHRWQEKSTNELRNNMDPGLMDGDYVECPKCKEELAVNFEYRGDM